MHLIRRSYHCRLPNKLQTAAGEATPLRPSLDIFARHRDGTKWGDGAAHSEQEYRDAGDMVAERMSAAIGNQVAPAAAYAFGRPSDEPESPDKAMAVAAAAAANQAANDAKRSGI